MEAAALSHGHYDHGDGFTAFFRVNRTAQIHARPAVQAEELLYGTQSGLNPRLFSRRAHRFDLADGPRELAEGLHLIPDAVPHEQSLAAETAEGLVVLNSCCHAGVDHILADLRARFPGQPIRAVLGGFHLMGKGGTATLGPAPEEVRALARRLRDELDVRRSAPATAPAPPHTPCWRRNWEAACAPSPPARCLSTPTEAVKISGQNQGFCPDIFTAPAPF